MEFLSDLIGRVMKIIRFFLSFEKLLAGKYLGELVRNVLVKLIREGLLFDGRASETFLTQHTFTTADVSAFET